MLRKEKSNESFSYKVLFQWWCVLTSHHTIIDWHNQPASQIASQLVDYLNCARRLLRRESKGQGNSSIKFQTCSTTPLFKSICVRLHIFHIFHDIFRAGSNIFLPLCGITADRWFTGLHRKYNYWYNFSNKGLVAALLTSARLKQVSDDCCTVPILPEVR